jgi:hypothetical protein
MTAKNNLALWDAVSTTDPADAKFVNQRGGFHAIDAYSQIRRATEVWGPVGLGWGWTVEWADGPNCVIARVTVWYDEESNAVNHVGCASWGSSERTDTDAPKKALTDGVTKCLSLLGFNADVFMGKFDSNKYTVVPGAPAAFPPSLAYQPPPEGEGWSSGSGKQYPQPQPAGEGWLDQTLRFGKFKGKTWRFLAEDNNGEDPKKIVGWLQWAIETPWNPETGDPKFRESNAESQRRARAVIAMIEDRPATVEEPHIPTADNRIRQEAEEASADDFFDHLEQSSEEVPF